MDEITTDHKHMSAQVLDVVDAELSSFEYNADEWSTVVDAATDVVQRLYFVYGVVAITD